MPNVIVRVRGEDGTVYDIPAIIGPSAYDVATRNGFKGTEKEWLESLIGGTIDLEMSDESDNPVRNNVIKDYIDSLTVDIDDALSDIDSILGEKNSDIESIKKDIYALVGGA